MEKNKLGAFKKRKSVVKKIPLRITTVYITKAEDNLIKEIALYRYNKGVRHSQSQIMMEALRHYYLHSFLKEKRDEEANNQQTSK